MDSFDTLGIWHVPAEPDVHLGGRLEFSAGAGIRLHLLAANHCGGPLFGNSHHELIVGTTETGKTVSLVNCVEIDRGYRAGFSAEHRVFLVSVGYFGVMFDDLKEAVFSAISFSYDVLPQWTRRTAGFAVNADAGVGSRTFTFTPEPPLNAATPHGAVTLAGGLAEAHSQTELALRRTAHFHATPVVPTSLDQLLKQFHFPVQTLLTLAARRGVGLNDLHVRFDFPVDGEGNAPHQLWLDVCMDTVVSADETSIRHLRFSASDLAEDFEERVAAWFALAFRLEPVVHLWHAAHAAKRTYIQQKF